MTGNERADLQIAIGLIKDFREEVTQGLLAVRAEQAQQFGVLDTRLRNAETLMSNDKAIQADRAASIEANRITKRWVIGAVISVLGAGGGILALAAAVLNAIH